VALRDPGEALVGGVAHGGVGGVEAGREAHHAVVRGAALSGSDGDGRRVAAVVQGLGQR